MSHKAARIGITGLVLVLAFVGLMYSTLSEGTEYYKHVDEVLASPAEWQGKRLQVHGFAKDVRQKPGTLEYRFDVENNGKVIRAYYAGIAPDTFKNDAEVVIKGALQADGTFLVNEDGIMAKCPSKYEPRNTPTLTNTGTE
ncbi:MAG: cytochrome c maturation protein CcmE [Acidimicrobiia bacterium]|nr:cytochrome c maturation protein CcmE [Acidimicrobiia bacterium]